MREDCCLNGVGPFLLNAFKFSMLHISLSARVAAPRRLRKPRTLDAPPRSRNGQRTDGDAIQHAPRSYETNPKTRAVLAPGATEADACPQLNEASALYAYVNGRVNLRPLRPLDIVLSQGAGVAGLELAGTWRAAVPRRRHYGRQLGPPVRRWLGQRPRRGLGCLIRGCGRLGRFSSRPGSRTPCSTQGPATASRERRRGGREEGRRHDDQGSRRQEEDGRRAAADP